MALNEVYRLGVGISLPVPAGTKSGDPVRVGLINAVAQTDAATAEGTPGYLAGQNKTGWASVKLDGAHLLPVTGAVATHGLPIYITSANALTATATGNALFGVALETKGAGAGSIVVRIDSITPAAA